MELAKRQFALIEEIASLRNELARLSAPLNERIETAMKELASLMRGGDDKKRVRRGATRKAESKSDHILRLFEESPTADYSEITTSLYGNDTPVTRNRMRTLLYVLKGKGLVKPRPEGGWEVLRKQK
jgi:hypothetical protein